MDDIKILNGSMKDYTIILTTKDYRKLGQITGIRRLRSARNLNGAQELSFTVVKPLMSITSGDVLDSKTIQTIQREIWDQIIDLRLIYVKELDEYFEIKVNVEDSSETIKSITATSLCEAELSQIPVQIEINTEEDIERDDYIVTKFCDMNNAKGSLLHRLINAAKIPFYKIKHVDESLMNLQRTFSIDTDSIYDFLVGDCAEQFNCLFRFDTKDRSISVYDLYTVCESCGERGEFYDKCPKCGSLSLKYYGEDTTILVDKNNLTDSISLETNSDSTKNCLKLVAGDELMTSTVRMLNPSGTDTITTITDYMRRDMAESVVKKLEDYDALVDSYREEYESLVAEIYDITDDVLYLQSGMMPIIEHAEVTASTEAAKLTQGNLSPLGLTSVSASTSLSTVNSALKTYARVYVNTGTVKLTPSTDATFAYKGTYTDDAGNVWNYGEWTGYFTVENYSDEEDVVQSPAVTVTVHDNYYDFVEQKILKNMAQKNDEDSVFDVLNIKDMEDFKYALTLYGASRLESFYNAIQSAIDVLIELDQASESAELYSEFYEPYYNKLQATQEELNKRNQEIADLKALMDEKTKRQREIQKELDFETYIGDDFNIYCLYRREQKYTNSNYISDGLSNTELIDRAKEFVEAAKKELEKAAKIQYTLSSSLYNLLVMKEFKSIREKFKLGNWIRLKVDKQIFRLRLLGYVVDFDKPDNIEVTFSTATKNHDIETEIKDIISAAKSMSKTFHTVAQQAEKGKTASETVDSLLQEGLNSAQVQIQSNDTEDIVINEHGLIARTYDDITNTYAPEQFRLTHNILAYTKDGWRTVSAALGKHEYTKWESNQWKKALAYGLSADFLVAGWITGSQMIGGEIVSANYEPQKTGTYFNLMTGDFDIGGGKFAYDTGTNKLCLKDVSIDWSSSTNPDISFVVGLQDSLNGLSNNIEINKNSISSEISRATAKEDELFTKITQTATEIRAEVTNTANSLSSSISQTATQIRSEVKAGDDALSSTITQTASSIRSEMLDLENNLSSKITQSSGNIELMVQKGEIVSAINLSPESIVISSDKIDVDGVLNVTKLNALGITAGSVDAENITGTTISGKTISGGTITGATINNGNGTFSVDEDGNVVASKITVTGGSMNIGDDTFIMDTSGNVSTKSLTVTGGSLNIGNGAFTVSKTGALYCSSAEITGKLKAGTGSSLGCFSVDSNSVYSGAWDSNAADVFMSTGTSGTYKIGGSSARNDWAFGAGGKFGVTTSGAVYCSDSVYLNNGFSIGTGFYITNSVVHANSKSTKWDNIYSVVNTSINSGYSGTISSRDASGVYQNLKFVNGILTSVTALAST